tara:strand:+ start:1052 stop:1417 length:366 start_codon:yes stop_codon:yes gene_type:complete
MSLQQADRTNAIIKERDAVKADSAKAISELVRNVARARLYIVFLHDSLLKGTGDMSEGDRLDLRASLAPHHPSALAALAEIESLLSIHNDDLTIWQNNFDAYLLANPTVLEEALNRFPKVD